MMAPANASQASSCALACLARQPFMALTQRAAQGRREGAPAQVGHEFMRSTERRQEGGGDS